MVIYNLFTSVVELNSFVLGSTVQSSVIHFSHQWLTEDHIISWTLSNHIEPPVLTKPPSVLNIYVLYCKMDKCDHYISTHEAHITSATVYELYYSKESNVNYKYSIKYIESDRCHMCHPSVAATWPEIWWKQMLLQLTANNVDSNPVGDTVRMGEKSMRSPILHLHIKYMLLLSGLHACHHIYNKFRPS